jgi:hypothetical protein
VSIELTIESALPVDLVGWTPSPLEMLNAKSAQPDPYTHVIQGCASNNLVLVNVSVFVTAFHLRIYLSHLRYRSREARGLPSCSTRIIGDRSQ